MDETLPIAAGTPAPPLAALYAMPYHDEVIALLRRHEPEAWAWASSAAARSDRVQEVRAFLLQNTYRLDADAHPQLHACCAAAAVRLGVTAPVTIYQGSEQHANAALLYLPGEAHIVFNGSLLERLSGAELEAVCGHELAHHLLYERDDGAWFTASRLLGMAQDDPRSDASLRETARLFALNTEAFADRGGAVACGALEPAVAALVKSQTGLTAVSAASYLRQADEICAALAERSDAVSHPEVFVRARALRLWCEAHADGEGHAVAGAEAWLRTVLEGPLAIDALDLLGQQRLTALTRRVIGQFICLPALRSSALLAWARRFFPDAQAADAPDPTLRDDLAAGAHDYVAALLLDFAVADRSLEDVPLAQAIVLARDLGLPEPFEKLALKALKMTKRQFTKARGEADALLARVAEAGHA
jgi:Zn-dependent protease with chaperone function